MRNYYELLGVSQTAEITEIKQATQRKIAHLRGKLVDITHHPQQAEIKKLILEELQQVKEIYTVLSDSQQRQRYDSQFESIETSFTEETSNSKTHVPLVAEDSLATSPYQPPSASISDFEDNAEFEFAGRGTRLAAHVIDNIIYITPILLFIIAAVDFGALAELANAPAGNASSAERVLLEGMSKAMTGTLSLLLWLSYLLIAMANLVLLYRNGQSIGKRLLSIKIVKSDGSRAGLARLILLRAFLFSFVSLVPFIGQIIYYLIDPLFIFQESRRCLHDLFAGTMVIKAR